MKFARFLKGTQSRIGIVNADDNAIRPLHVDLNDLHDLFGRNDLQSLVATAGDEIALKDVQLQAPIIPRRNIICVGKNYRAHAKEFATSGFEAGAVKGAEIDEFPAVFSKPPSTVIGTGATVELHPGATSSVDYEAELALVIGKAGRNIPAEQAFDHIWGYTIINDVTARDRQRNHKQWFLGKALDTFCPMGPWITTADEVRSNDLQVQCWVNDELRQSASTSDLIFDIPTLIATISAGLTLQPGDVIATGTPAGVGIGFTPPRFLKSGDEVSISISGLGTLSNRFE
ncbi:fumarylacetoacetate hydrolase family protein [Alcaligenaceae bacterium]|nr:fumarylacetoacetate hydrolase family protein [Alcaligenaceae bacterium]